MNLLYSHIHTFHLSSPTVDRTLQSLRQRSVITLVMSLAELYAMCIRIYLWSLGKLDTLQIEMTVKNCMFLFQVSGVSALLLQGRVRAVAPRSYCNLYSLYFSPG